jgi:DNA-binding response OmpR family regulator
MSTAPLICLIEDDELLGETLCERFRIERLTFEWHRTAASAVLALQCRRYAAVLCDLRLPDGSGSRRSILPPGRLSFS